ncbi:hypothetical protein ABZ865_38945 [Streptomyces sp. NPDC047085]|uniref:hypothetical protein n=1 Tax=Streptomyces sp. NPDC047085 TaxID=3155140 RepID=UPI00340C9DB7
MRGRDHPDFVQYYRPYEDRSKRVETERFKAFTYEELIARDKANLGITWLRDPSLDDADELPPPRGAGRRDRRGSSGSA